MKQRAAEHVRVLSCLLLGCSVVLAVPYPTSLVHAASPITPSGLNTQVTLSAIPPPGKIQYDITGGTRPGGGLNLFHSFGNFNVPNNNIANFLNDSGLSTSNILGRVTGGNLSNIFGTIQTTGFGNANLFLMNPAGFLFGPNATVNVGGTVTFTTADYLRFTDNARFNAVAGPADALLTVAPLAAFGFLGSNPGGTISIQGGAFGRTPKVTMVGRDLTVGNTTTPGIVVDNGGNPDTSVMAGNEINLVSVGQPADPVVGGEVNAANFAFSGFGTSPGGNILISSGQISTPFGAFTAVTPPTGTVTVSRLANITALGGGPINIQTGNFLLQGSLSTAAGAGDLDGGPATVTATQSLTLDGGSIRSSGGGPESFSGPITLTSPSITLTNSGQLIAGGIEFAGGVPGPITLNVGTLSLSGAQTQISSNSTAAALPRAGTITIQGLGGPNSTATSVNIAGQGSGIFATTKSVDSAGNIFVNAQNISLSSGASISSASVPSGNLQTPPSLLGDAGKVTIFAPGTFQSNGGTVTTSTSGAGRAGTILVNAGQITLTNGAQIVSSSTSADPTAGPAGTITIQGVNGNGSPARSVSLDNSSITTTISSGSATTQPASIGITARTVNLTNGAQITADTSGAAPAGSITANVGTLTMTNGAQISSSSTSADPTAGPAGTITIQGVNGNGSPARSVSLDDSTLSTTISGGSSTSQPASIGITARTLNLTDGPQIKADTGGAAPAGEIDLNVGTLRVSNATLSSTSTLADPTAGNAGTITIQGLAGPGSPATSVRLDHSTVSAESGQGNGGTIRIEAGKFVLRDSQLTTSVSGGPQTVGGQITVDAKNVTLNNSQILSTATEGQGGTIQVDANKVGLTDSQLATSVTGGPQSVGGTITVDANKVTFNNSQVLSTATEGNGGTIGITTPKLTTINSVIDATSQTGTDGTVTIQQP